MKLVFVSYREQLEVMESIVSRTSDIRDIDSVREIMIGHFREQQGKRYVDFDFEPIPKKKYDAFLNWMKSEEE